MLPVSARQTAGRGHASSYRNLFSADDLARHISLQLSMIFLTFETYIEAVVQALVCFGSEGVRLPTVHVRKLEQEVLCNDYPCEGRCLVYKT